MSETNERILFLYLRDSKDPMHVATLARYKEGNLLTFAWAINKVSTIQHDYRDGHNREQYTRRTVHDVFSKARGRSIAEARLASEKTSVTIELYEGERPLKAMLETLASNSFIGEVRIPSFLSNWAREALVDVYTDKDVVPDSDDIVPDYSEELANV
jgi:hypothetical protein